MSYNKKEWILMLMLIFIVVMVLAFNNFTQTVYDLNLYECVKYSRDFTQEEISYLNEEKVLYFTSDINAPPFSFQDKKTGEYKGFVLDYATALSIELNTEIKFVPRVWEEAIQSVVLGESHMTELFSSDEREKYLSFTNSIYTIRAIIMIRSNEKTISKQEDLYNHKVAIESGDYANEYIKNNIPGVIIVNTVDYQESVDMLLSGEVDAIVGDEPILIYFMGDLSLEEKVSIINHPLYEMDISLGVNKSDSMLVNILNKGIFDLKKNDFATKIQQKWFGLSAPVHKDRVNAESMFLLIIILILLAVIAFGISMWTYILKKQVVNRTMELDESRNDLQMTFDAISSFLIVIDENGLIENINESFSNLLQKNKIEILGLSYNDVSILSNIKVDSIGTSNEAIFNGRYYTYYITPLEYGKNRLLISMEDNTNEIANRQQMLQHNKMIAVGQLAAGLAHEIRNPLGIIRNYCYVLKTKMANKDQLTEKAILSIESSVLRAGKMVENLLNFSRSNHDEHKCIFLKDFVKDILTWEKKAIENKKINVSVNCNDNIEFCTKTESLTHIVFNLLSNAIDAVSEGGEIFINCREDEDYLYMDFKDTGEGIEEYNLDHIFNPFYTTKKAGKGTGLGLFIVYSELQKINGEVVANSKVGEGTEFKLKFKLKEDKND